MSADDAGREPRPLAYFDLILADFDAGRATRHAHLGHWDDPTAEVRSIADVHAAQRRMTEVVVDLLDLRDGHVLADVGCGLGGAVDLIQERGLAVASLGINIDPRQIERCRSIEPGPGARADWILADGARLPFGPDSLDRVLCLEALPHLSSRSALFAEAARVLRPGGVLVVTDLLVTRAAAIRLGVEPEVLAARMDQTMGPWPDPIVTVEEVVAQAAAAGLRRTAQIDATAATAPSHALSFAGVDPGEPSEWGDVLAAEQLFSWLHERELIECHYLAFAADAAGS